MTYLLYLYDKLCYGLPRGYTFQQWKRDNIRTPENAATEQPL